MSDPTTLSPAPRALPEPAPDRATVTSELLHRAAVATEPERHRLIDEVILVNRGVAESVARRFGGRGEERDDIVQVAYLGLVKAAQRFDARLGDEFLSFAVPTITGEIKRHFRDHGWTVRPPRRLQELHAEISVAAAELSQSRGRSPTPADVADHLGADLDDVVEAMGTYRCFRPASLDALTHDGDGAPLADSIGDQDTGFDRAEIIAMLRPLCAGLGSRDQRILFLRFFRGRTQQEIADDIGVSQMQVSRVLSRIFTQLREALEIPANVTT